MKQHITDEQIRELSEQAQAKLVAWNGKHGGSRDPYLNIGEMIEFLGDELAAIERWTDHWDVNRDFNGAVYDWGKGTELADALWEACEEVLEKEEKI